MLDLDWIFFQVYQDAGIFCEEERRFLFLHVPVGTKAKACLKITNPNKVWCLFKGVIDDSCCV